MADIRSEALLLTIFGLLDNCKNTLPVRVL